MERFKGKRVFISGGNGVIGNALVMKLHALGAVIFVGDLKPRPGNWPKEVIYRQGDLNLISQEELDAFSPVFFFHLAATFERSVETYSFWSENFRHNVRLGHHLMTCLKDSNSLKKVIFASSYLIYEPELYQFSEPRAEPYSLTETDPIYPRNLTGVAKLLHEIELRFINGFKRDNFKIVSARIFRGHGLGSKDIISRWVRSLIKNETLIVYRKQGKFDYIFSEDTAEGLLRLADAAGAEGVVNLGTGRSRSVGDVLEILRAHFPFLKFVEEDSAVDIPFESSQANVELLTRLTGWRPDHSLEDSIHKIVKFERQVKAEAVSTNVPAFNVLVTSVSAKVPLLKCVKDGMNKAGIIGMLYGADSDNTCIGRHFVDVFWEMPRLHEETVESIIQYCVDNQIRAVIPTRDGELAYFSKAKVKFDKAGIQLMVSEVDAVLQTVDKLRFYKIGSSLNFPVIETSESIRELNCLNFVVKERYGAGSRSIGLNLGREAAEAHGRLLEKPVFQPFVHGNEFSVDLYISLEGKVKGVICRSREKVVNGESQVTVTMREPELEALCSSFAESLKFYGHILFQVIKDRQGNFHIVECNARFGGASSLSITAGLESFYWFLVEVCGAKLSDYAFARSSTPLRQIRFASDITEHLR